MDWPGDMANKPIKQYYDDTNKKLEELRVILETKGCSPSIVDAMKMNMDSTYSSMITSIQNSADKLLQIVCDLGPDKDKNDSLADTLATTSDNFIQSGPAKKMYDDISKTVDDAENSTISCDDLASKIMSIINGAKDDTVAAVNSTTDVSNVDDALQQMIGQAAGMIHCAKQIIQSDVFKNTIGSTNPELTSTVNMLSDEIDKVDGKQTANQLMKKAIGSVVDSTGVNDVYSNSTDKLNSILDKYK